MFESLMSPPFFRTSSIYDMKTPSPALLIYVSSRQLTIMLYFLLPSRASNAFSSSGVVWASRYPLSSRTLRLFVSRVSILNVLISILLLFSYRICFAPLHHDEGQVVL